MIRCLCAVFHLAKSLVCTSCSLADRFCKQFIFHKMGTGTGCKKSAVFYQFHSTKIDLTVAFDCIFDRTAGFCKCRWIQNDHIVLFSLFFELRKQFKNIFTYKFYGFIQTIQFRIFLCLVNSKLRCIYSCYFFRSGDSCIQCKRTGMCKAVQYPRIFTELLNRKTIIFLVKEKSCLLSVFDIDLISDTIFLNFDKCRKFFSR